jgi:hypothetical protein
MSYRNAIPDIFPGSIWLGLNGCQVVILTAAARHVLIQRHILRELLHERDFRAVFVPLYDHEQVRQQFTMSLANLGEFRVYWVPSHRRVLMRSISCRRQFRVPDGATLVGTYGEPCAPAVLFRDLDRLLAPHAPERQEVTA